MVGEENGYHKKRPHKGVNLEGICLPPPDNWININIQDLLRYVNFFYLVSLFVESLIPHFFIPITIHASPSE